MFVTTPEYFLENETVVLLPNKDNAVPSSEVNTDQSGRIEVAVVGDDDEENVGQMLSY